MRYDGLKSLRRGWNALPRVVATAPPRLVMLLGLCVVVLGALIVFRPLTSLWLLGVYVGLSAIVSGLFELSPSTARPSHRVFAALWILGGLVVLIWLGRSLELLPMLLAVLLLIGGLSAVGDALRRGRVSQRVLSLVWGAAQIAFGVLALTWPDVTLFVVAVLFGIRTIVAGVVLAVRGTRDLTRLHRPTRISEAISVSEPGRAARVWAAAGRYALAIVIAIAATGSWWVDGWLANGAPVVDAFYAQPDKVPTAHGELIRTAGYSGNTPPDADVQRILYTTRDALGRAAVGSSLVISPKDPQLGPRPVVIWNHGTTGIARGCAPSLRDDSATRWAIPGLNDAIAQGWVVVAPDYSGQGAPGTFPYLIGKGEAYSALDAALAARSIDGLWLSRKTVLWGHSQGGHAALWSGQVAEKYSPSLEILGVAALAPVTDPLAIARTMAAGRAGFELSLLSSWVLVPYADTYADVRLEDYVATGGQTIVREMSQRCPTEPGVMVSVAAALGVAEDRPLFSANFTAGPLGQRLKQNAATGPGDLPMLVVWGSDDEVIPTRLQEKFVQERCEAGQQVRWLEYRGIGHQQILQPPSPFVPVLLRWTAGLIQGDEPPVDDCVRRG